MAYEIKEGMLLPEKVNNVKKGSVVMLGGFPCKVVEMKKSKPGKHGSAKTLVGMQQLPKIIFVFVDLFFVLQLVLTSSPARSTTKSCVMKLKLSSTRSTNSRLLT